MCSFDLEMRGREWESCCGVLGDRWAPWCVDLGEVLPGTEGVKGLHYHTLFWVGDDKQRWAPQYVYLVQRFEAGGME